MDETINQLIPPFFLRLRFWIKFIPVPAFDIIGLDFEKRSHVREADNSRTFSSSISILVDWINELRKESFNAFFIRVMVDNIYIFLSFFFTTKNSIS